MISEFWIGQLGSQGGTLVRFVSQSGTLGAIVGLINELKTDWCNFYTVVTRMLKMN